MKNRHAVMYIRKKIKRRIDTGESRTDWEHVDALTDKEIEKAVSEDPDTELLDDDWIQKAELVMPESQKERITIRVDRSVLDYFRQEGPGYQSRINAVLRAFVQAKKKQG